jgi:hypothetical protein
MSFVTRAKEKLKKEYDSYKYNKQLENNPEVIRNKLEKARTENREQNARVREQIAFERDKQELKSLQKGNSRFGSALTSVKEHLNEVKQQRSGQKLRQKASLGTGRNIIYDESPTRNSALTLGNQPTGSRSLIMSDVKNKTSVFGHQGGVTGNNTQPRTKKKAKTQGKTIVIKL